MLLDLFSVETLDTRLKSHNEVRKAQITQRATPSRWNTLEFYIYGVIFLICVPLMIKAPYDLSKPSNPNYPRFNNLLTPGWMGRPVDNSDLQYQAFRSNIPALAALATAHVLLRRVVGRSGLSRVHYDALFGIILITGLHGFSAVKILAIFAGHNFLTKYFSGPVARKLGWVYCVGLLFANELLLGYRMAWLSPKLAFLDDLGIMPRWEVFFKCSILRMISYTMDYTDAKRISGMGIRTPEIEKKKHDEESMRINTPRPLEEYSFPSFLGYCLYAPLFLAGPILSFNDYMAQSQHTISSTNLRRTARYALRFALCLLCMELIMHYTYVVAISSVRAWDGDTPFQISMIALFNLAHIWLKLLLPWRFFRLWALVDSIDPPENMVRCVANNYSALAFWRSWHRSFHKWVVHYLYIPLGGSSRPVVNSLIVFSFVAIWHDIQLRLLIWGWLIVLFVLPEVIAGKLFPAKLYAKKWWYRHLCAVGGAINVWMMMIANLVGFAVGVDGIKTMLHEMMHTTAGLWYIIVATCTLFVGVQVMFEVRETEHRKGIDLKC